MKRLSLIFALALLVTIAATALAFGVDHMIIHFKNGNTQKIDLNNVQRIEFQTDAAGVNFLPSSIQSGRSYQLIAKHSGKCLDVAGAGMATGANVYQWDCHGGPNQQWILTDKIGGYYVLTARHSGKCLDVAGVSNDNGANIYQWDCHSGPNQQWMFIPQGQGYYRVKAKHSGKCLDVAGVGKGNGENVHQWDCHGGDNQLWQLK